MKNIDKLISNISFEVAQNKIKFQDVHEEIAGKDTTFFTYSVKSLIVLVAVLVIPIIYLISVVQMGMSDVSPDKIHLYVMINSIFVILLLLSLYIFYKLKILFSYLFLNHFKFLLTLFLLTELSIICYGSVFIVGIYSSKSILIVIASLFLYIMISCKLVLEIIATKIYKVLNDEYASNVLIKKWRLYFMQIPIVSLLLILGGMQIYRLSKSAFIFSNTSISFFGLYAWIGKLSLGLVAVVVALLPTLFFNAQVFVKVKLLSYYSEEFRQEYDFTKEEWYGEE